MDAFLNAPALSKDFLLSCFQEKEPFYYIFQAFISSLTDSYTVFFLLIAIFFISCVGFFVYKYSKLPVISFMLFMSMGYFSFSMAGLRQTIAMGILLLALHQILNRHYVKSLLLIFLASLFHIVSWIFILVYLLKIIPSKKIFVLSIILCVVFYLFGDTIWRYLVEQIWGETRDYTTIYGGISTLLLLTFVSVASMLFYPKVLASNKKCMLNKDVEHDNLFFKMLILSIAFQMLALQQANAFRVAMIFHMPMLALLPNAISVQDDEKLRKIGSIIVVFALCVQLFMFTAGTADILPFTFFWQV